MPLKILLVNAIDKRKAVQTVYPPLGLAYISSYLKKHMPHIQVKIIDGDVQRVLRDFSPDVVGVSSVSQNFSIALQVGKLCNEAGIPAFVGGVHISMLPECLTEAFEFGVVGEGEETVFETLRLFSEERRFPLPELEKIRGLVLKTDGIRLTGPRPLITELDSIPFPERDLLNIPCGQTTYLFSSRGCPYNCSFCASTRFWRKVRFFSAEYVVNELETVIHRYRPRAVAFYDDLFIADMRRFEEIIELMQRKGVHKKVKVSFSCRANLVNEKLVRLLKQIDVYFISLGLESGCEKTLNRLSKGITPEQNRRAVKLLTEVGILVNATFIIGTPGETEEDILETLQFIKRSRLTTFDAYILTPFPGTPMWTIAEKMGLVSTEMDWRRLAVDVDNHLEDKVILSDISRERLLELYRLFQKESRRRKTRFALKYGIKHPLWVTSNIARRMMR